MYVCLHHTATNPNPPKPKPTHPPTTQMASSSAEADATAATVDAASSIVFQCASCRRIVGDSLALTSADEDLRHITLRGACGIVRGPCPRTSEDGKDLGSTFHELFCEGCNALVGKAYLTTPPPLDAARNLFTLSTDALESFELGRYDHTCELPAHLLLPPPGSSPAEEEAPGLPSGQVQLELTKLQNMMLVFHDRISTLERALKAATHGNGVGRRGENVGAVGNSLKRKKK